MDQGGEAVQSFMEMTLGAARNGRWRPSAHSGQAQVNEQQSFDSYSGELDVTYGDGVDLGISPRNRNIRGRNPTNNLDGTEGRRTRRKHLQRLNLEQTHTLEGFFSICAHPDETQRRGLSETTGLTAQQVKFWFQNKRTQVKNLSEKEETYRLKVENVMLRDRNKKLQEAQRATYCPTCDSPPQNQLPPDMQRLKEQNDWMKLEISRLHAETLQYSNRPLKLDYSSAESAVVARQNDTQMISELAQNAMHEFVTLAESHGPLWLPVPGGSFEILNKMVYAQKFGGKNIIGFKTEATRADAVVMMNAKIMMDYLMDPKCYVSLCPGILASAKTIKVYRLPTNAGSYDGAMHLMTTESVFPSPLVQSRKCTFVRYCRVLQNGSALVVDVSLDGGDGTFFKCRKMPSGVLIQPIERNSCKVIAIEHVLVDDTGVHELYQPCLSGLMFGARRWLASITRQCVRIRDLFLVTRAALRANSRGKKTLMKLADDMLVSFSNSIATIPEDEWTIVRGAGTDKDIKVAHHRIDEWSNIAIVSVSASFQLPKPLRVTFDLLRNNMLRPKWDVLVTGGVVREEVRVSSSIEADDAVSILHVKLEKKQNIMILQNSCYDVTGSFIVYSPIDNQLMDKIMSPGDMAESKVSIYPTGFSLLPVGESAQGGIGLGEDGETLVTVGFQILLKLARGTGLYPRSVTAAIGLMSENIKTIKESLINSHPVFYRSGQDPSPI